MLCRLNLVGGRKYILIAAAKEGLKERSSDWPSDKTPIAPSAGEDAWQVNVSNALT